MLDFKLILLHYSYRSAVTHCLSVCPKQIIKQ